MEAAWEVKGTISIWNWVKLNLKMKKGEGEQASRRKKEWVRERKRERKSRKQVSRVACRFKGNLIKIKQILSLGRECWKLIEQPCWWYDASTTPMTSLQVELRPQVNVMLLLAFITSMVCLHNSESQTEWSGTCLVITLLLLFEGIL